MNRWVGMGRLTRDPDVRQSQGDGSMTIARFTLAVDRKYKKQGETSADFISCVAFKKTAEVIEKYCRQGTKIVVEGHIQTGSYTNKDGVKVYTTDIMVDSIEFAESKAAAEQNQEQFAPSYGQMETPAGHDGFLNIPDGLDDELPFN